MSNHRGANFCIYQVAALARMWWRSNAPVSGGKTLGQQPGSWAAVKHHRRPIAWRDASGGTRMPPRCCWHHGTAVLANRSNKRAHTLHRVVMHGCRAAWHFVCNQAMARLLLHCRKVAS